MVYFQQLSQHPVVILYLFQLASVIKMQVLWEKRSCIIYASVSGTGLGLQ